METTTSTIHIDSLSADNHFLKMEDLHNSPPSTSPAPSFDTSAATGSQQSPPPVIVHSKQAKKRKSWGQELPEPKTALPPRKRAKTDDEKEQRRIERIKRNRAAAHNSRERKRQEAETLAVQLARANAELEAYRRLHGPLPSSVVLPEVHISTDDNEPASTPAPSLVESHGSVKDAPSPASPAESIFHNAKTPLIKQEPLDYNNFSTLPPAFDNLDSKPNVVRPAVSVQQPEQQHDFSFMVDESLPFSDDYPATDMLQDSPDGNLDAFAFTDGAYDASFNGSLFSFDQLIDDSATTFAVDAQASGAA
ncbi:hypothetical protein PRZ48_015139 [Zasmidium cellare]|uniref:BZIP domain-containing protein n=1 Tax=Zasmidium cellare TaxID=395010 RepID=A0ABR0DXQ4_ZASCE|nr:hypothetical protein PRZ48_015139 [Zasmidium cellare]